MSCEKLVYGVRKPVKFSKRNCTIYVCGRYKTLNVVMAFSNREYKSVNTSYSTYSYCTPLLSVTVLSFW